MFNVKDPGSRLVRWCLALEEYGYKIAYKQGKPPQILENQTINEPSGNPLEISTVLNTNQSDLTYSNTYQEFLSKMSTFIILNNICEEINEQITNFSENVVI